MHSHYASTQRARYHMPCTESPPMRAKKQSVKAAQCEGIPRKAAATGSPSLELERAGAGIGARDAKRRCFGSSTVSRVSRRCSIRGGRGRFQSRDGDACGVGHVDLVVLPLVGRRLPQLRLQDSQWQERPAKRQEVGRRGSREQLRRRREERVRLGVQRCRQDRSAIDAPRSGETGTWTQTDSKPLAFARSIPTFMRRAGAHPGLGPH